MSTTSVYTPLPDGLDDAVPGERLAALVRLVNPAACNSFQIRDLIRAQYRQVSFHVALLLVMIDNMARTVPGGPLAAPEHRASYDCFADTELGCAVRLSGPAAAGLLLMSSTMCSIAPELGEAMLAGDLDQPKLRMLSLEFGGVDRELVRAVVAQVRPDLARLTRAQLQHRVRRLLLAADPTLARQRIARAHAERAVVHDANPDGTATLSGFNLPVVRAAAAWEHITAIATATHHAGDPLHRTLDQLRADVYADLLAGVDPAKAGAAVPAPRPGAVYLHVNVSTLAGLDDLPAEVETFGPVLADIARDTVAQVAARTRWRFVATDDEGRLIAEGPLRPHHPRPGSRHVPARSPSFTPADRRRPSPDRAPAPPATTTAEPRPSTTTAEPPPSVATIACSAITAAARPPAPPSVGAAGLRPHTTAPRPQPSTPATDPPPRAAAAVPPGTACVDPPGDVAGMETSPCSDTPATPPLSPTTVDPPYSAASASPPRSDTIVNVPRTDPAVSAPHPDTTANAPCRDAPANVPPSDAPVNALHSDATVNAPRGDATVNAPRSDATVNAPRGDATVNAPRSDATVNVPRGDATVNAPRSDATVNVPRSDATVNAPRSDATVNAPRSDATVSVPPGDAAVNARACQVLCVR